MGALTPHDGEDDVIVALATPPGVSAVAILRLSGPPGRARHVAATVAPRVGFLSSADARRLVRTAFVDGEGTPLDEGLAVLFEAPRSATGEEVVELHAHGSTAVVSALLEACRHAGARPARPGEFTRRALANGKVDLAGAEGIERLVRAEGRADGRRALGLVKGALSQRVVDARERLLDLLADLEASLDFAEDVAETGRDESLARVRDVRLEIDMLLAAAEAARPTSASEVVLAGKPNAGKSTLFNALLGEDRAIVTEHPGTTRDAVAEALEIEGERVRLVDTAGLRTTTDEVESIGVDVATRAAARADLVLCLVDGSVRDAAWREPFVGIEREKRIVVLTKSDAEAFRRDGVEAEVVVSARTREGLDALRESIAARLGLLERPDGLLVLDRHREALERCRAALCESEEALARGDEWAAAALRRALVALGEITGETATEELLDRIFSRFCVGK